MAGRKYKVRGVSKKDRRRSERAVGMLSRGVAIQERLDKEAERRAVRRDINLPWAIALVLDIILALVCCTVLGVHQRHQLDRLFWTLVVMTFMLIGLWAYASLYRWCYWWLVMANYIAITVITIFIYRTHLS